MITVECDGLRSVTGLWKNLTLISTSLYDQQFSLAKRNKLGNGSKTFRCPRPFSSPLRLRTIIKQWPVSTGVTATRKRQKLPVCMTLV